MNKGKGVSQSCQFFGLKEGERRDCLTDVEANRFDEGE